MASKSTVGATGAGVTFTVTLSVAVPPAPLQLIVNVVDVVSGAVVTPALLVPVQPPGVTVHAVALADVQLIVAVALDAIVIGP